MTTITVTYRGTPPKGLRAAFRQSKKAAYAGLAQWFHETYTHARFTEEHAQKAGYYARKGQNLSRGSKAFARSYYGRKLRSEFGGGRGLALPLVYTGQSRDRAKTPRITSTSEGGKIRYSLPRLNFKNPKSRINPREEFSRVIATEKGQSTRQLARRIAEHLKQAKATT